jgi:HSP20 family protein
MNLIPWRKHNSIPAATGSALTTPISDFRTEIDRLFDRYFRGSMLGPSAWAEETEWMKHDFMPSVDVAENDKQITIRAEVAGMAPDDVDISVSGNVLTIHGEKKESSENTGDDFYHSERRFGSFTRSIELPATADLDKVTAEQVNGVLTVTVTKVPTAKAKKIQVKGRELVGSK